MANRMISYGYGFDNAKLIVLQNEAEVVRKIFNDYANGVTLMKIAKSLTERQVEFYQGKCNWNKNNIARIVENEKYIGKDDYPAIVESELFERTNKNKKDKGYKKTECTQLVEYLKSILFCEQCGELLHRRATWTASGEKWICHNKCKIKTRMNDAEIIGDIFKTIERMKNNGNILIIKDDEPFYSRTQEIMRCNNEVLRIANSKEPSFAIGKKAILQCVTAKFTACREDKSVYTDYITRKLQEDNHGQGSEAKFLKSIIEKITIDNEGIKKVHFINGAII